MEREFAYVDIADGKKAIKTNEAGFPIFIESDGEESVERTADVFHLLDKVHSLSGDLSKHKEKSSFYKDMSATFVEKGILSEEEFSSGDKKKVSDWLTEALEAKEKLNSLSQKDFDKIKNYDEMRSQLEKARDEKMQEQKRVYETQIDGLSSVANGYKSQIRKLMIQDKFGSSAFIKENCPEIPPEVIANTFGGRFELEEDEGMWSVVGYNTQGKQIYSPVRAGDVASFDEALEQMIKDHPSKNFFLRGISSSGTGNDVGGKVNSGLRAQYDDAVKNNRTVEQVALKMQMKEKQKR